mmetsp:Transcript_12455/g.41517  ORF Transcript_12455/g.41517 Transcript_12455/m.41517 type:complete len:306 (-) Transcript_12455:272-1189(-)
MSRPLKPGRRNPLADKTILAEDSRPRAPWRGGIQSRGPRRLWLARRHARIPSFAESTSLLKRHSSKMLSISGPASSAGSPKSQQSPRRRVGASDAGPTRRGCRLPKPCRRLGGLQQLHRLCHPNRPRGDSSPRSRAPWPRIAAKAFPRRVRRRTCRPRRRRRRPPRRPWIEKVPPRAPRRRAAAAAKRGSTSKATATASAAAEPATVGRWRPAKRWRAKRCRTSAGWLPAAQSAPTTRCAPARVPRPPPEPRWKARSARRRRASCGCRGARGPSAGARRRWPCRRRAAWPPSPWRPLGARRAEAP